jgi:hypothetical protein
MSYAAQAELSVDSAERFQERVLRSCLIYDTHFYDFSILVDCTGGPCAVAEAC